MRNMSAYTVLYQGSSMSYHVTGLSAGQEYFFFIMANTSVGGTESTVVSASIPVERIEPSKYPCKENSLLSEPEVINRDESRGNKNAKKKEANVESCWPDKPGQ